MKDLFYDYLTKEHAKTYIGVDDDMPSDCEDWIIEMDIDKLMDYCNAFAKKEYEKGLEDGYKCF